MKKGETKEVGKFDLPKSPSVKIGLIRSIRIFKNSVSYGLMAADQKMCPAQCRKCFHLWKGELLSDIQSWRIGGSETSRSRRDSGPLQPVPPREPRRESGVNCHVTLASHQSAVLVSCIPRISAQRGDKLSPLCQWQARTIALPPEGATRG